MSEADCWKHIGRPIESGQNWELFKVERPGGRFCFVKYIKSSVQLGQSTEQIRRKVDNIASNWRRLQQQQHQNIARILEVKIMENAPQVAVVIECVEGVTLESLISKTRGAIAEEDIRYYSKEILKALAYLHSDEVRVLHRNVSSSSIVVVGDRRNVKLQDFGTLVQLEDCSSHLTQQRRSQIYYQAPEVISPEQQSPVQADDACYDSDNSNREIEYFKHWRASDIWAFGCLVFEMATGHRPYTECNNTYTIVQKISEEGAPPLESGSQELRVFYQRCVVKNRHLRATAQDLLDHPFLK